MNLYRKILVMTNRKNFMTLMYICVFSYFLYKRLLSSDSRIDSMTLKKYIVNHHNKDENSNLEKLMILNSDASQRKYVLFWTKFWNLPSWYLGSDEAGEEMLKSLNCPITNCVFTHNKTLLTNVTNFDSILFHGAEKINVPLPSERSDKQFYVFANLESPLMTFEDLTKYTNFYNLTMTYRLDSDIEWNYGKIVEKSIYRIVSPSKYIQWRQPEDKFFDQRIFEIILKKKNSIAWFVSNCNTKSNREKLVENLKKYFKIDIFGKCGRLQCLKNSTKCTEMLTSTYMFYLSFENSLCKDYVTEKLYRALSNYIIPIVFNGADTAQFAPPYSYIDANDFDTVDELVKYLKYLVNNPKEYIKYFWWKQYYEVLNSHPFQLGFCDLCMKLHDSEFIQKKSIYTNIDSWWKDGMCKSKPNIEF